MTWVITRLCRDCVDQACVDVCPVECIYEYTGDDKAKFPNQLYIHPDECIDCGACEPECPWEAIFEDASVPGALKADIELNKELGGSGSYQVPARKDADSPTPEQVSANKAKWGV
jgi:ferredoxin